MRKRRLVGFRGCIKTCGVQSGPKRRKNVKNECGQGQSQFIVDFLRYWQVFFCCLVAVAVPGKVITKRKNQCCGYGSAWIRNLCLDPELGKFKAGSRSGINSFGSATLGKINIFFLFWESLVNKSFVQIFL